MRQQQQRRRRKRRTYEYTRTCVFSSSSVVVVDARTSIWLLFLFHQALEDKPRLKVRPPRLGGNKSMGVFATRATHRPNGIGQSVVKLDKVEANRLFISGIDLLDGTPILDIKPYVPYADIIADASNSIASAAPQLYSYVRLFLLLRCCC